MLTFYYIFIFLTGCSCSWAPGSGLFMTNCSYAGLTSIPKTISNLTSYFLLTGNNFSRIKNNSFSNLVNLIWLDLSNCHIYHIESDAFQKLETLKLLSLKDNHLCEKNNSYADGVFDTLRKLKFLDISGNLKSIPPTIRTYPGNALKSLQSLEVLSLDCVSGQMLSKEFQNLTNLKELDFSHGTEAEYLPNDMFDSISNVAIETVNFTNVNLTKIKGSIFAALKSLEVLDLTENPKLQQITKDIALALQNTSIRELYLAKTCIGATGSVADVIKNLKGTNITVLTMDWNQIHNMGQSHIFKRLPNLEVLTVTHNNVHDYAKLFANLFIAQHLRKLDISYQNTFVPPSTCGNQRIISGAANEENRFRSKWKRETNTNTKFPIIWPKKLEWLSLSFTQIRFSPVPHFRTKMNGSLKYLDVSNNVFATMPEPFFCYGAIPPFEHVDVSNCEVQCVTNNFFRHCKWSLKFLNASHNKLGLFQGGCNKNPNPRDFSILFEPLTTLVTLDISYNSLSFLYEDFLKTQKYLRELTISHNDLTSWRSNMTKWIHLELLDLSYNSLTTLSLETRLTLNKLDGNPKHRTKEHISLNLVGNPLKCTCENIPFLQWLARWWMLKHTSVFQMVDNWVTCLLVSQTYFDVLNPNVAVNFG